MSLERVNPTSLPPARGFSHAVVVEGRTVYLAGQTALGADGHIIDGDVVAQFEQAMTNLLEALRHAGGRPDQLVSLTIYVVRIERYKKRTREIGDVWRRLVGADYPAMALVEVSRLWDPEALVEVQGIAAITSPEDGAGLP
jgi:enamine deaminase RidA (YjgF/YER057c/UK114 family)